MSFHVKSHAIDETITKEKSFKVTVSVDVDQIYETVNYDIEKSNKAFIKGLKCEKLNHLVPKEITFDATRMGIININLEVPSNLADNFDPKSLDR